MQVSAPRDPAVEALLAGTEFTPIYRDWLRERDRELADRWASRGEGTPMRVLLINATRGVMFYPAIVDFLVMLRKARPEILVTCASYSDEIYELGQGVVRRGMHVARIRQVLSWGAEELARFDRVIAVGVSEALLKLMQMDGLKPKLVLLDLGFYHQIIDSQPSFLDRISTPSEARADAPATGAPGRSLAAYTCQPIEKIENDLVGWFPLERVEWQRFSYIPTGFAHTAYYRASRHAFDVALLGTGGRDYSLLEPSRLRGLRFLFIGRIEQAPDVARLQADGDVTVASGVAEDDYAKLLASCRCVAVPLFQTTFNVLLSVVDAMASGVPLVATPAAGFDALVRENAPLVLHADDRRRDQRDPVHGRPGFHRAATAAAAASLADEIRKLLADEPRRRELGDRAIAFTKERLDICHILETIFEEQVLG
jgi:hypothetical protein